MHFVSCIVYIIISINSDFEQRKKISRCLHIWCVWNSICFWWWISMRQKQQLSSYWRSVNQILTRSIFILPSWNFSLWLNIKFVAFLAKYNGTVEVILIRWLKNTTEMHIKTKIIRKNVSTFGERTLRSLVFLKTFFSLFSFEFHLNDFECNYLCTLDEN